MRRRKPSPETAALAAHLRYVDDRMPGITRHQGSDGFFYRAPQGKLMSDRKTLDRIAALAVPPAWVSVWICPDPSGHIQATGRDARGRKQYRYHSRWRAVRDETKYEQILQFGRALPHLRERVSDHLARPGLPREKVIAAVVRLMERTLARIGNPEYAKENGSFGLTTLQNRHVRIAGGRIELDFRGKHGIRYRRIVSDRKLARILRNCRDLPGAELFQFVDEEGERHAVGSEDVNAYLRDLSGLPITSKDFRTWSATNLAVLAVAARKDEKPTKKAAVEIVTEVSQQLGNTPAVCRSCYIHPRVMAGYLDGSLAAFLTRAHVDAEHPELWSVERLVMRYLAG